MTEVSNSGAPISVRSESVRPRSANGAGLLVLVALGAVVALGPLSTDAYVPGLPQLAADLNSSAARTQLTVTTCLIGLAVGQLVAGPLSDAVGRRRPLLLGLGVYLGASVGCALAPSVEVLVAFRGVQGLGGAFGLVVAYACVRDRFAGPPAARYFSRLLLVTGLAPVLAPLAGAQLLAVAGWRSVFLALAVLSAVALVLCWVVLDESLPASRRRPDGPRDVGGVYVRLLRDRRFVGYTLANAFTFAAMFAYISGSPFVLQTLHGLSPQLYSVVFAVNAVGLVTAAQVSGRLVGRVRPVTLLGVGATATAGGGLAVLLVVLTGAGLWPLLTGLFVVVASVGLVLPNATALALEPYGAHAGAASALLGVGQFLLGGLAAPLVGILGSHSPAPLGVMMAALGVAAVATVLVVVRPWNQPVDATPAANGLGAAH